MAWTFCSKEDITLMYPIEESDLEDAYSELVEGLIQEHQGTPYLGSSTLVSDEYHDGDGTDSLAVHKPPIVSVSSLEVNTAALTASDYIVKDTTIQLKYQTFPSGRANVKISYYSGQTTNIPQSVRLAAMTMIVALLTYKNRYGADGTLRFAQSPTREGEMTPVFSMGVITHLKGIMKNLLRRDKIMVG